MSPCFNLMSVFFMCLERQSYRVFVDSLFRNPSQSQSSLSSALCGMWANGWPILSSISSILKEKKTHHWELTDWNKILQIYNAAENLKQFIFSAHISRWNHELSRKEYKEILLKLSMKGMSGGYSLVKCDVMQDENTQPLLMDMLLNSPPWGDQVSVKFLPWATHFHPLHPPREQSPHMQGFLGAIHGSAVL